MRIYEVASRPLVTTQTPRFAKKLAKYKQTHPELGDALEDFIEFKTLNPIKQHSRKDNGFQSGKLKAFRHEHLILGRVLLIYQIANGELRLCEIVNHKEIDGAAKALSDYLNGLDASSFAPLVTSTPMMSAGDKKQVIDLIYDLTQSDEAVLRSALAGNTSDFQEWVGMADLDWISVLKSFGGKDGLRSEIAATMRNVGLSVRMDESVQLIEATATREKFWVDTTAAQVEFVFDHDEYGHIRDAITDGYVQGEYSNTDNTYELVASNARTLSLALRVILTNHSSAQGCSYRLLDGQTGYLDYVDMMAVRNTGTIPMAHAA